LPLKILPLPYLIFLLPWHEEWQGVPQKWQALPKKWQALPLFLQAQEKQAETVEKILIGIPRFSARRLENSASTARWFISWTKKPTHS
jgi:hypothetical protein